MKDLLLQNEKLLQVQERKVQILVVILTSLPVVTEEAIFQSTRVPDADVAVISGVTTSSLGEPGEATPQIPGAHRGTLLPHQSTPNFLHLLALPADASLTVMRIQCWGLRWRAIPLRAPEVSLTRSTPSLGVPGCESEPFTACHLQRPVFHDQATLNVTAYFQGRLWAPHRFHSRVGHPVGPVPRVWKTVSLWKVAPLPRTTTALQRAAVCGSWTRIQPTVTFGQPILAWGLSAPVPG